MIAIEQHNELIDLANTIAKESNKGISFRVLQTREVLDSTFLAMQRLRAKQGEYLLSGAVIDTPYQLSGRGQQGNTWYASQNCNILPSFYVNNTNLNARQGWVISEWVAWALAIAIKDLLIHSKCFDTVAIKWPNDIFIDNKKVAGILIEHALRNMQINYSIVGFGINVNEPSYPTVLPDAVSLKMVTGKKHSLTLFRNKVFKTLQNYYPLILTEQGRRALHTAYNSALYRKGVFAFYREVETNRRFSAAIDFVDERGFIHMIEENGAHRSFAFKEVVYENMA